MTVICRVEGCDKPGAKRTRDGKVSQYPLCGGHRTRYYKYGDVMAHVPIKKIAAWGEGWITPAGYRAHSRAGHPLASSQGHLFDHRAVLYDAIGPGAHPCHWCGVMVAWEDPHPLGLEVDHLDGDKLNNEAANLVPTCHGDNTRRWMAGNRADWKRVG